MLEEDPEDVASLCQYLSLKTKPSALLVQIIEGIQLRSKM